MAKWVKLLLGLFAISLPFIIEIVTREKYRVKEERIKGCTCKHPYIGLIDDDCPYHRKFYIRHYITLDGRESTDIMYASYGETNTYCSDCIDKTKPKGYIIQLPQTFGLCSICGKLNQVFEIPIRDIKKWEDINSWTEGIRK